MKNLAKSFKILILKFEGHTEAVGTISYNLALGEARAQTVATI